MCNSPIPWFPVELYSGQLPVCVCVYVCVSVSVIN